MIDIKQQSATGRMFIDPQRPGIVRWNDDPMTGILAGVRAQEIVTTVNAYDDMRAALETASFLIDEITDLEGREGLTDHDFAEQVLALAHSKREQIRAALSKHAPVLR